MAAPYSLDLRQKILPAHERGLGSQRMLADLFGVSLSFVERLLRRYRTTATVAPKQRATARSTRRLGDAVRQQVRQWVQEQPDLTLAELAERLCNATGIRASVPTLCRVLQQLDLPRKKNPSMPPSAIPRKFGAHRLPKTACRVRVRTTEVR